jgi:hypothetical protein
MLAMLVTMLLCGNAAATAIWHDFIGQNEVTDYFINCNNRSVHYTHDITDEASGFFDPSQDFVSYYTLTIYLSDDSKTDGCEIAYVNQPGLLGDGFYQFNYTSPDFGWSLLGRSSLNETGKLDVDILRVVGDFYFVSSKLAAYGCKGEEPHAVSEPGAMMILGFGLFGLAGCARKRFKR